MYRASINTKKEFPQTSSDEQFQSFQIFVLLWYQSKIDLHPFFFFVLNTDQWSSSSTVSSSSTSVMFQSFPPPINPTQLLSNLIVTISYYGRLNCFNIFVAKSYPATLMEVFLLMPKQSLSSSSPSTPISNLHDQSHNLFLPPRELWGSTHSQYLHLFFLWYQSHCQHHSWINLASIFCYVSWVLSFLNHPLLGVIILKLRIWWQILFLMLTLST